MTAFLQRILYCFMTLACVCIDSVYGVKLQSRIINGTRIVGVSNLYSWLVSIQYVYDDDEDGARNAFCSGSLIRSEYPAAVLTAAHCVGASILPDSGRTYYADIGRTYPYETVAGDTFVTLRAFYYYISNPYATQTTRTTQNLLTDYDLAVLLLDGSVSGIAPITLFDPSNAMHTRQCCRNEQTLRAFGYGFLNDEKQETDTARYLDMTYTNDVTQCSQTIIQCVKDKYDALYQDELAVDDSAFCAYADAAGICQGDSGGPLVIFDNASNAIQVGVGSQSCCIAGIPNMFANIAYFYQFIQSALNDTVEWKQHDPNWNEDSASSSSSHWHDWYSVSLLSPITLALAADFLCFVKRTIF